MPKNLKIFVTGGAGFIGSHFIRYILRKYPWALILNYDKLTYAGDLRRLKDIAGNSRTKFLKGDIADFQRLRRAITLFRPQYLVNFAAETHVDRSIYCGTEEFVTTNIEGVRSIADAVRMASPHIKKYLEVSSIEVYGSLPSRFKRGFREEDRLSPQSPYAATKAAGDLLCLSYFSTFNLPVVVAICANNYGPFQHPEKFIPFFVLRLMEGKKLPLYGDGRHVRNWIYVLDTCAALERCLFRGTPGQIYNVGTKENLQNIEIARMILRYFGKDDSWIEFVEDRPADIRFHAIDSGKIEKEFEWRPHFSFSDAFLETMRWYKEHKSWLMDIRKNVKNKYLNPHLYYGR